MCDAHAAGGERGKCIKCPNVTKLRKATCELCNAKKDTSFKRDLVGSESSKDGPFKRVICYTCAKGEKGDWMVPVKGYTPREVLRHHQC